MNRLLQVGECRFLLYLVRIVEKVGQTQYKSSGKVLWSTSNSLSNSSVD